MNIFSQLFRSNVAEVEVGQAQARLRERPAPFLLDVREPEEYQAGHIEGAKLIPLGQLAGRMHELPADREIICVCRSGNRSGTATRQLNARGYKAANLRGGMLAWARTGLPVKQGK